MANEFLDIYDVFDDLNVDDYELYEDEEELDAEYDIEEDEEND